jgi:DNA-directed RNA polymerase I subunit RPA43
MLATLPIMPSSTPKPHKDRSEKKSSKKRKLASDSSTREASPTKKHRSKLDKEPESSQSQSQINSKAALKAQLADELALSPFHLQTSSLYLPISPVSLFHPLEGLCAEHLSPLILTYYPPFRGVVLSYSNPRLSESALPLPPIPDVSEDAEMLDVGAKKKPTVLAVSIAEYGPPFVYLTAEFLLFKPKRGTTIEGYVNLQSSGHIGLVCYNLFNASIPASSLPEGWKFIPPGGEEESEGGEEAEGNVEGFWMDDMARKVEGKLDFKIKGVEVVWEKEKAFLSLEGSLLSVEEEKARQAAT